MAEKYVMYHAVFTTQVLTGTWVVTCLSSCRVGMSMVILHKRLPLWLAFPRIYLVVGWLDYVVNSPLGLDRAFMHFSMMAVFTYISFNSV